MRAVKASSYVKSRGCTYFTHSQRRESVDVHYVGVPLDVSAFVITPTYKQPYDGTTGDEFEESLGDKSLLRKLPEDRSDNREEVEDLWPVQNRKVLLQGMPNRSMESIPQD